MSHRSSRIISFLVAGICSSGIVMAQQSSSTLKGRVVDAGTGAAKVGVVITVTNPTTGVTRSTRTDDRGFFIFTFLPVASYQIVYSYEGQTYKATRAAVLGQEVDATFKWPVTTGATVTIVSTSVMAQSVDTATAQIGTSITEETLASLPMATRDINTAAVLAPGVAIVSGSNVDPTKKSSSYIMAGEGMGRGTNYAVDGSDNNSTDVGGYVLPVPFDAVAELQVVTNQFKAEFGRSNQGFFNVLTKSGTNDFAGIVSAQYQNQAMRARRTDEGTKSDDSMFTRSATVSGPIVKDLAFFMVSAEQVNGQAASFDFTARPISIDPSLAGARYNLTKKNVYSKIDFNPSNRINTSWTYGYYQDETANQAFPRTSSYHGNVLASALGTGRNKTWAAGVKMTFMITDRLVWESNFHHFDYANTIRPTQPGPGNGSTLAVIDDYPPYYGGSDVARTDPQNVGYGGIDPNSYQGIKRTQWKNDLSWISGDHNIRGGMDLSKNTYTATTWFYPETGVGRVYVGPGGPNAPINYGTAFNNILNADQNVYTARFVVDGYTPANDFNTYAFYVQDEWTVNPKLTLYGGIRLDWDTQLDYLEKYDTMYAQIRANTLAASETADPSWNTGKAPRGKKYVSPRFQLTYRPNGDDNFAIKFGAGQFVAQVIDNVTGFSRGLASKSNGMPARANNAAAWAYAGMGAPPSYVANSFLAGSTIGHVNGHAIVLPSDLTPYNYANNVGGLRDYFTQTVNSWLTTATADSDGKSLLESDFQYPQTTTVNFGVSYRFSEAQAVEANILYSRSKHLTANIGLDGAGPKTEEYDSNGDGIGDSIFYSNQQSSSLQLQIKYTYQVANTSVLATLVIKDQKASEGGAAGAFDGQGATGGLYGEGARYGFQENPLRRSAGTERFEGSFNINHKFSWGTNLSLLGQWHSGRAYDVTAGSTADTYTPFVVLGHEEGMWALNLDMRIAQKFSLGHKTSIEPFVAITNVLNNYDYGANYDGQKYLDLGQTELNDHFGQRFASFQANAPRTGVVGCKITF